MLTPEDHTLARRRFTPFSVDLSQLTRYPQGMRRLNKILILSIFPGIDLLGRAFEEVGFCVVRGPDLITGGDIHTFHPPQGRFDGIIGGPPCQQFSLLNRHRDHEVGRELLDEYGRVVSEAAPDWYLYENVQNAPGVHVPGYESQRFGLDLAWFTPFSRARDFVYGSRDGDLLNPMLGKRGETQGGCVTSKDVRSFSARCELMGLPADFSLPFFSKEGQRQAIANGVPMALGRYVAGLIAETVYGAKVDVEPAPLLCRCACGCGRVVLGQQARYAGDACRQRMMKRRRRASGRAAG